MSTSESKSDKNPQLRCYCGQVRLTLKCDSPFSCGYCHCTSCRRAHSAPIYSYFYVPKDALEISQGKELLKGIVMNDEKKDTFLRYFCTGCGSRMINWLKKNDVEYHGSFHSCFVDQENIPKAFLPQKHIWCENAIFGLDESIQDQLPRYEQQTIPNSK